jgi:hypothetical protein
VLYEDRAGHLHCGGCPATYWWGWAA